MTGPVPNAPPPADRPRLVTAFLAGVASLLAVELLVAGALLVPPANTVAGTARPAPPPPAPAAAVSPAPPATGAPAEPAPPEPEPEPEPEPAPAAAESGQRPGTLRLPGGGTATLVRKEVVGPNAVLPVPENLGEATWWGAGLGAPSGASVFAGHVNWRGRVGPFAELWHAEVGARVTVVDADGKAWTYRISQVLTLHKDELPNRAGELFAQSGPHRIVLVTCGGRWLGGNTGYADNRVVIAEPA
ncbi:Sortase family protein [Amycolatopsis arida]|uniref:Sortase family protein n=1 Tax=Amycolatopsis arida TaxID=587909 RepID=A0A1I5PWF1_9PSEU|nr:class F sortase [Amycolatopsis arida]TDX98630.1 sortase family protein [Amycolatopsis arida]SFP38355.1 Sortase family protein [Amycolatopsis arida]